MPIHLLLIVGLLNEQPHRKRRVGFGARIFIVEAVQEDFEEAGGVGRDGCVHGADAFGEDANSGGALEGLGAGGEAKEGFLDHFVEFGEGGAEDVGNGNEDVERGVDNEPIVLGGLDGARVEVFVRGRATVWGESGKVNLAGVFAG